MTADALALALEAVKLRKALEHGLLVWAESGLDADGCSVCRVCGAAWGPGPEGTSAPWHREGNACAAASAALAPATKPCGTCGGSGWIDIQHPLKPAGVVIGRDPCPACSGTGRAPVDAEGAVREALWDLASDASNAATHPGAYLDRLVDAALARLASLPAPDAREAEALLLCREAVEAQERWERNVGPSPPLDEPDVLQEQWFAAHAAAVAALAAHEARRG